MGDEEPAATGVEPTPSADLTTGDAGPTNGDMDSTTGDAGPTNGDLDPTDGGAGTAGMVTSSALSRMARIGDGSMAAACPDSRSTATLTQRTCG